MTLSGFSFVRNGIKLYYPIVESIKSILPIVDEFVIAVGRGDSDDATRDRIVDIGDPKIKIIDTVWEEKYFEKGVINALQTDIAKEQCSGDWLFYLQADEVVHENYLPIIKDRCEQLIDQEQVEGLLFSYKHFWGDYNHYQKSHGWYPREIRLIRNRKDIHSWQSAQSFRRFDYYENPRQPDGHHKLKVAKVDAEIYHYGWVRPPHLMQNKKRALDSVHWGFKKALTHYQHAPDEFDYGPMDRLSEFKGTHPKVMQQRIKDMNWQNKLQKQGKPNPLRQPHKHETIKYRFITALEQTFFKGKELGGFQNYILLDV
ncbi:MAG: hypothetical protein U5R06_20340 [candidate division KSB1 bacterium]|nr:hypothetical protein [candidate division KSB1 bacterium]